MMRRTLERPRAALVRRAVMLLVMLAAGGLAASEVASEVASDSPAPGDTHHFASLNGVYRDLDFGLVPVRQGGLEIGVESPENTVHVHENRVTLTPADTGRAGDWLAHFEAVVEGDGRLVLSLRGTESRFDDRVEIGRQRLRASAVVRLLATDAGSPNAGSPDAGSPDAGGLVLEIVEPRTDTVRVQMRSDAAAQIVATCRSLGALGLLFVSCDGLQASLAVARVPMPPAGSRFTVPAAWLDASDHAFVQRHAEATMPPDETPDSPRLTDAQTHR